MKKYITTVNDSFEKNEVEISGKNEASVNGEKIHYEYKFMSENALILRINNRNYSLLIDTNENDESIGISLDSKIYKVISKSETDLMMDKLTNSKNKGKTKKDIKSPMPGIIKSLNVKNGQSVSKGEVMLVLEAMKMENEIKAREDCIIKTVNILPMSSVEKNELLIVLE